jgi:hypothetical protein
VSQAATDGGAGGGAITVALDSKAVYWGNYGTGKVMKLAK